MSFEATDLAKNETHKISRAKLWNVLNIKRIGDIHTSLTGECADRIQFQVYRAQYSKDLELDELT